MEKFRSLRKSNRAAAWAAFQDGLMQNAHLLVPGWISPKEFTAMQIEIENFLKNESGSTTSDPVEQMSKWLAGTDLVFSEKLQ